MDGLTNGIDFAKILAQIAAGGIPSWIAAGVLGIVGILLYVWWQKQKAAIADGATDNNKNSDLSGTLPANTTPQNNWDKAGSDIDHLRDEAKKKLATASPQMGASPQEMVGPTEKPKTAPKKMKKRGRPRKH